MTIHHPTCWRVPGDACGCDLDTIEGYNEEWGFYVEVAEREPLWKRLGRWVLAIGFVVGLGVCHMLMAW